MKAIKPFRVSGIWRTAHSIQAVRTNTNFQRIVQSVWHTLLVWKEQLSDYEIIQPIEQLEKKVYTVDDTEKGKLDLLRFNDRELTLLNRMTKMGWYKVSVQDAGCFYTFYREDITKRIDMGKGIIKYEGNAVELTFSGMYVAGDDENVSIERVRFYEPRTVERGSYVYNEVDDKNLSNLMK